MAKANWQGYVNIRLEKADKAEIKKRAEKVKPAELWAFVLDCVNHGYQFSVSPDPENGAMIATLTGKDEAALNAGLSMSQRHADPAVAVTALMYAHNEMASGGCWEDVVDDWKDSLW